MAAHLWGSHLSAPQFPHLEGGCAGAHLSGPDPGVLGHLPSLQVRRVPWLDLGCWMESFAGGETGTPDSLPLPLTLQLERVTLRI